ncbi:hydrogenase 2 maturation protease [Clostridium polyendosporum]|uniref:Hydrogenase 2 maturation protease n=1 Tax=Clostridium polyendosporum TaxID=69208 RepID=A0A919VF42_9CLOT|nr:hydrogenase maturation protease [Clostridium polyendosporum]GIM27737.1 hydrogenase 2 maturation protease [Clostridium polyendosporum]
MKNIAVVGIGNILLRDDGIGIHVINMLQKEPQEKNVEIFDGGTCIFSLIDIFVKNHKVIIVDSLKGGHPPGTVYKVTPEELGSCIKANSSLHDVQVLDILNSVKLMGYSPEVIIIGVEPKEIFYDMDISSTLREQIPKIIEVIKEELGKEVGEHSA